MASVPLALPIFSTVCSTTDGVLHVSIQTENQAAKELILSQLSLLEEALENQSIELGGFEVDVDPSSSETKGKDGDSTRSPASHVSEAAIDGESVAAIVRSANTHLIDVIV